MPNGMFAGPQQQNPGGLVSLVRGIRGIADMPARREATAQYVNLMSRALRRHGTSYSQELATVFEQSPRAFIKWADDMGGMNAVDKMLAQQAQQQALTRVSQQELGGIEFGLEPDPQILYRELAPHLGHEKASQVAKRIADIQRPPAGARPEIRKDIAGYQRYVETGKRVFPGIEKPEGFDLSAAQKAQNEEIEKARQWVSTWQEQQGKTKAEMRVIAGRGEELYAALQDESEFPLASRMFRTAFEAKVGGDPNRDEFLEKIIGLEGEELPRTPGGKIDSASLVAGRVYNIRGQRYRWNSQTRIFEEVE